jgi:hypothetical protein
MPYGLRYGRGSSPFGTKLIDFVRRQTLQKLARQCESCVAACKNRRIYDSARGAPSWPPTHEG